MSPDRPLPDPRQWYPRDASQNLLSIFGTECNRAEERLLSGLRHEIETAVDNVDSGVPFEGLARKELKQLLPSRYNVMSARVMDRNGKTAGNCDVVIYNQQWFPLVKAPP